MTTPADIAQTPPSADQTTPAPAGLVMGTWGALTRAADCVPLWTVTLFARLGIAGVFWRSGQTKVSDWEITGSTYFLFQDEYKVPFLPPELAAQLATVAEHVFPVLLVLGLFSRLSALALLGMTAMIQIFVYPVNWPEHALWAAALLLVILRGPGPLSLDYALSRRLAHRRP